MANKQQAMKAKKQARRKEDSKKRRKAAQDITRAHKSAGGVTEWNDKNRSVYDLLNNVNHRAKEHRKKRDDGVSSAVGVPRIEFLKGLSDVLQQVIQSHAGIAVYMKLVDEQRFELTAEAAEMIETFERSAVRLVENVDAIILLDQAGKQPDEYLELVIDVTDVMRDIMMFQQREVFKMLKLQKDPIDEFVTEHKPTNMPVGEYMRILHEERIKVVGPQYATEGVTPNDIVQQIQLMDSVGQDDLDLDHLADEDLSNLPADDMMDVQPAAVDPQDPIAQALNKEAQNV